jgi:hypothetical protein
MIYGLEGLRLARKMLQTSHRAWMGPVMMRRFNTGKPVDMGYGVVSNGRRAPHGCFRRLLQRQVEHKYVLSGEAAVMDHGTTVKLL